ncbi:restriction endonuclease subunit S [Chryseobacterium cucumeris]|nr:restriction endonuclease subunit S [Chryseobacterium cucumeris]
MTKENKSVKNFPNLRFPGFEEEWEVKKLGDIIEFKAGYAFKSENMLSEKSNYQLLKMSNVYQNELRLDRNASYWENINDKVKEFLLRKGDSVLTLTGTVGKKDFGYSVMINEDDKYLLNQRLVLLREKKGKSINGYISQILLSERFLFYFFAEAKGGTGNQTNVGVEDIKNIQLYFPIIFEQQKIADFLEIIDTRIQTQKKIIEGLIALKIQSRNNLFTKISKGDYEIFKIEEILSYEQPTKYIVSNTDYSSDTSLIPVLTANKAFILGYTNEDWGIYNKGKCIVLDDFTMDLKYVDFPFKVKSSAIKLLTPKINVDLKFIFEYFSFLNLSSNEHKRHYISEIQPMFLNVPPIEIQNNISNFLSKLDEKINLETTLLTQYENQKKYLLQNLFV